MTICRTWVFHTCILVVFFLGSSASVGFAQSATPVPNSGPKDRLIAMQSHLRGADDLSFRVAITSSTPPRQATATFAIRRPNMFRVAVSLPKGQYNIISDGKVLSIERPAARTYAQYKASTTLLGTMYTAVGLANLAGRMLDFFWTAEDAKSSPREIEISALPAIKLDGKTCNGVRVKRLEEIHQVWISADGNPTPCKLVTRRTDGSALSVQTFVFRWADKAAFDDKTFRFEPAAGSRKVDALGLR